MPSCFHNSRSASVEKPLRSASSGVHITPGIAAPDTVSHQGGEERKRKGPKSPASSHDK